MNGRKEIGSDARQSPDSRAKQAEEEGSKKKRWCLEEGLEGEEKSGQR